MQKNSEIPELLLVSTMPTKITMITHEHHNRPDGLWQMYVDTLHIKYYAESSRSRL